MLDSRVHMAQVGMHREDVLALAGGQPMLELVQAVEHSAVAADAPAELRLAAKQVTLTDAAGGAAVEVLYRMVRDAEKSGVKFVQGPLQFFCRGLSFWQGNQVE